MIALARAAIAGALVLAPASVLAAPVDRTVNVGAKGGSQAFAATAPGPITVKITAPSAVRARLVGPKGEVATKGPATSLELTAPVTEADVAAGKLWAVVLAADAPGKGIAAQVKIDAPGTAPTDKDLLAQIDAAARAAPKIPQGLPPPTPLLPDAVSVARIVTAKIPGSKVNTSAVGGKIVRNATTIPDFVPRPPPVPPKPGGGFANANNYGGVATAGPGRTTVPIVAIDVSDDEGSKNCGAGCPIKAGDVLTFTLGPKSETIGHEVHFVFFEPQHDYAVSVLEWKDDVRKVSVQVPRFGPEAFDKIGAIYLGTASGTATSVFWGFLYDPTITLFLPMDAGIFGPPAKVYATTPPDFPEYAYAGPIDNRTRWVTMRGAATSYAGKDTFFAGVTLKNGWTVRKVESQGWASSPLPTLQAIHTVSELKPGGVTPTFTVDFTTDAATTLYYSVGVKVQGRDGTLPF